MGGFIERAAAAHAGVRVLGSAALSIAQVALGHAAAAVLHSYHEWDVAGSVRDGDRGGRGGAGPPRRGHGRCRRTACWSRHRRRRRSPRWWQETAHAL